MDRIAIYDLDRTVTRLPTWSRFLLHAALRHAPLRLALLPLVGLAALLNTLGLIDRKALKQMMHRLMLGRSIDPVALSRVAESFADREAARNIRADARVSIAADRAAGCRIVLATAAHRFYAAPIARRLSVTDVIATESETDASGHVRYRIAGENCYGEAKARAIERQHSAASDRKTVVVHFYSDHVSDLPTFEAVDEPVAVNPGRALRLIAEARGWRVVLWR